MCKCCEERSRADAARIRALESALLECADDLEARIDAEYTIAMMAYPHNQQRYAREMEPVKAARTALGAAGAGEGQGG